MLVTCPQCRRSIETHTSGRDAPALAVCPCCGKFAARVETLENQPKATTERTLTWLPPAPR